ncbi:MAG: rRNA pseudouridine synthase [Victivallales bacterium]|nr:rRNA pseudouridine synthase [Victivallales bacterium]
MRLDRYLALSGIASRRHSAELVRSGLVSVNGVVADAPGLKVSPEDDVLFRGRRVFPEERCYVMLNKPRGYICSASDPHACRTIYQLVDIPGHRLFSAGRLDLDSEGLIILTDDGNFAQMLTHPSHGIEKRYLVRTDRPIGRERISEFKKGITDKGELLKAKDVLDAGDGGYIFVMGEGRKREIRRMLSSASLNVELLRRIAVGGLALGNLPVGKWRYLTPEEITATLEPISKLRVGGAGAAMGSSHKK